MTRIAALSIAVAVAMTGTVAGCGDDPDPPVIDMDGALGAAVDVQVDGCGPRIGLGSGSVIAPGLVVTAAHVVAGGTSIEMTAVDGTQAAGEVVLFDPDLDLALLRTDTPIGTPIALRDRPAGAGDAGILVILRAAGFKVAIEVVDVEVVRRANIRTTDIYLDEPVERAGFEIAGAIDVGHSGALVVLPGGGAGIVWSRSNRTDGRAWAIDLPPALADPDALTGELTTPVDVGPCIR